MVARNAADLAGLEAIRAAAAKHGGGVEDLDPAIVPGLRPGCRLRTGPRGAAARRGIPGQWRAARGLARGDRTARANVEVVADDALTVDAAGVHTRASGLVACAQVVLATGAHTNELLARSGLAELLPPLLGGRGVSVLVRATDPMPGCVRTPNRAFACGLHAVPQGGRNDLPGCHEPADHHPGAGARAAAVRAGRPHRGLRPRARPAVAPGRGRRDVRRPPAGHRGPTPARGTDRRTMAPGGHRDLAQRCRPRAARRRSRGRRAGRAGCQRRAPVLGDPRPDPGPAGRGDDRTCRAGAGRVRARRRRCRTGPGERPGGVLRARADPRDRGAGPDRGAVAAARADGGGAAAPVRPAARRTT